MMNFEVFSTLEEQEARVFELKKIGAIEIIPAFNGRAYTIKWR